MNTINLNLVYLENKLEKVVKLIRQSRNQKLYYVFYIDNRNGNVYIVNGYADEPPNLTNCFGFHYIDKNNFNIVNSNNNQQAAELIMQDILDWSIPDENIIRKNTEFPVINIE
jgi:hypothetical protein